jgi:hypothetical protein
MAPQEASMRRLICSLVVPHLLSATLLFAQQPSAKPAEPLPALPMAPDRADDSYHLYGMLLPLAETTQSAQGIYLVQDTTVALAPSDKPCWQPPAAGAAPSADSSLNPHVAVHPPLENHQDLVEILDDFDQHCHDRLTLDPDPNVWKLAVPIHLLNPTEQAEFRATRGRVDSAIADKYKGATAVYAFSEVYFNSHHSVAIVYVTHWQGGPSGVGFWAVFTLDNSNIWKRQLNWSDGVGSQRTAD